MGKRANTKTSNAVAKKAKTDPVLAAISDAIMEAEIPDACRVMLVEMLPFSLGFPSDERHSLQTMAVDMAEETLKGTKSTLEAAVAAADAKLADLKGSESKLATTVTESEAALAGQKEKVQSVKNALAEATSVERESLKTLNDRRAEEKASAEKLAGAQKEKAALEAAFEAHYKPIEEGTVGPHYKQLEKSLKNIEIEASLLTALPSSCAKTKEDRGSFDVLVIEELKKAICAKVEALGNEVLAETPTSAASAAAAQAAEGEHAAKKGAQAQAAAELEAALKELQESEAALDRACLAVKEFQPEVEACTGQASKAKTALETFEAGPLSNFMTFKNKVSAPPETATAPALEAAPEIAPAAAPEVAPDAAPEGGAATEPVP